VKRVKPMNPPSEAYSVFAIGDISRVVRPEEIPPNSDTSKNVPITGKYRSGTG
jgi:hypothetical protein